MGTVDKKVFLLDKVKSGGIVNNRRAIRAAEFSLNNPVGKSIELSKIYVEDAPMGVFENIDVNVLMNTYVLPLPSPIKLK